MMFDFLLFVLGPILACYVIYLIYVEIYFGSQNFKNIKTQIKDYIQNCNELNEHIENLKSSYKDISREESGIGELTDSSNYNMKRSGWRNAIKTSRVYDCSATVCKNASEQPFKYLIKYFNLKPTEETLDNFENNLNNFSAAEQGKRLLEAEKNSILSQIKNSIPDLIYSYRRKRLEIELGFENIDLSDLYFPIYTFRYVSAGGNSSMKCEIKMSVDNLEKFIIHLSNLIKFRKSVAGQRALMTSALRDKIKNRDGFSCQFCGIKATEDNRLLLEIDHIVPLSKGGITSEENLQTLCWKCNRSKGAKILTDLVAPVV